MKEALGFRSMKKRLSSFRVFTKPILMALLVALTVGFVRARAQRIVTVDCKGKFALFALTVGFVRARAQRIVIVDSKGDGDAGDLNSIIQYMQ